MGLPSWISLFLANCNMGQCWGALAANQLPINMGYGQIWHLVQSIGPGSMGFLDPASGANIM